MKEKLTSISNIWILINGDIYLVKSQISIKQLLNWLGFRETHLIVEYNQKILSTPLLDLIFLKNLDRLELVTLVGGG